MNPFKKQLGFVLPIAIVIMVVLIIAGGVGYYFYKTSQEKRGESFEEAILLPDMTEKITKTETISGGQDRYYKFWVDEGQKVLVTILGDVEVWICYPDHSSASRLERGEGTRGVPLSGRSSGYHYAVVQSFDLGRYTYTLTVQEFDEIADWKVYQDEKYGFEIKYPSGWEVGVGALPNNFVFGESAWSNTAKVNITVYSESFLDKIYKEEVRKKICTRVVLSVEEAYRCEGADFIYLEAEHNGKFYLWSVFGTREPEKFKIFDQMLSTFKFIEISEDEIASYNKPQVITLSLPGLIETNSITLRGKILDGGGADIDDVSWEFECGKARGIYTEKLEYLSGNRTGKVPQEYSRSVINLSVATTYYCRAKSCNSTGCGYGEEISFQTGPYYQERGGKIDTAKKIVMIGGKNINISNDTEMYCFDDLRECSLNEICREKICGPYGFALIVQYYVEDSNYYTHKLIYAPQ